MQSRRADAFPRNGAAGPGCQAATVADGRRTDAPRWRKSASCKKPITRLLAAVAISTIGQNRQILQTKTVIRENKKQGVIA